jgi:LPS-assembly protein
MRFRFLSVFLLGLGLLPLHAHAEELSLPASGVSATAPVITPPASAVSPATSASPSDSTAEPEKTVYIDAQQIEGKKDQQMDARGNVVLQQGDRKIYADHVTYTPDTSDLAADGSVRVAQPTGDVSGPSLKMNLDSNIGEMPQPEFQLHQNNARGSATMMRSSGKLNYDFEDATYTTCPAGNDDWLLKMSRLEIDKDAQVGTAHNAWVEFKGVPLLYTPWMDFPLDGRRRSGFLGPIFGVTTSGGAEITLPYYWNIAPNYDATIAPRVIDKRGVLFNDEFRYMGSSYSGEAHYDVLQNDRLVKTTRTFSSLKHAHDLGSGFTATANLNRASDDAYFRDLSNTVIGGTQKQLPNEGELTYGAEWWSASVKAQTFQTLQDPLAPVAIPYHRLPQVTLAAQKTVDDTQVNVVNEYVDFRHPSKVNGQRQVIYPSVTYALLNDPGFYLNPKLGVHNTRYTLGDNNSANTPNSARTLPIFSVDSGMTFERDLAFGDGEYVQTLEPRAYYVKIPYQDQSFLPNFDSSQARLSFAQMFTENRFFGNDRIGDANMMTAAVTTRLIDNEGGVERLRVAVGERFSFETPRVNLLAPDANSRSDILVGAGGRATDALTLDGLLQYNPNVKHTQSYNYSLSYAPETGKVLNLGYRYTRGSIPENDVRQADFSTQWPLLWHWYAVSRISYSFNDRRVLQALAGLEYNEACWMLRLVAQQFQTATKQVSTGIFVQLELNDLVALGGDPLSALRLSIPGYSKLNEPSTNGPATGSP